MSTVILRNQVMELMAQGAQLVDVLPAEEYSERHIQGAANIPLKKLNPITAARLERARPVITYCHDYL
jgi:rhodanese-related sulfurtransferase